MATTDPCSSARADAAAPAAIADLCAPYGNLLLAPRPGPGVCRTCFNLAGGEDRCRACSLNDDVLDLLLPISYSVGGGQLHHVLAAYKRTPAHWYEPFSRQLTAVLWRFLDAHERCAANALHVDRFPVVTTVPSGEPLRDRSHPLHRIVGERLDPTRDRYRRLILRSATTTPHHYDPGGLTVTEPLRGEPVLVIDDMWTTGATMQAAATALKTAGAGPVAAIVIGRHVNREWHDTGRRLEDLPRPFDWQGCALCDNRGL
jgi:hypothetical protein